MYYLERAIAFYRERAKIVYALAVKERDKRRQRLLYAISEHYYLLHDQLVELQKTRPILNTESYSGHIGFSFSDLTTDDPFAITTDPFFRSHLNDNQTPPGLTYVVTMDGTIIAYDIESWSDFASRNGAEELANAVGLNIFSSCSDKETVSTYRLIHTLLRTQNIDQYSFNFRCDSPEKIRLFRMTMSLQPRMGDGAILYRSELLRQRDRRPVSLFRREARGPVSHSAIKICSFCQSAWEPISGRWIDAEQHPAAYNRQATTTHGICVGCHEHIVSPLLTGVGLADFVIRRTDESVEPSRGPN